MTETTTARKEEPSSIEKTTRTKSCGIWTLTLRIRITIKKRLIKFLYMEIPIGWIPICEAEDIARQVEEEAFNAVGGSFFAPATIEILDVYTQEVINRMMDRVNTYVNEEVAAVDRERMLRIKKLELEDVIPFFDFLGIS